MDEHTLLDLKKDIDEAKTKVSELKGTLKHLMTELKTQWKCSTVKEAKTMLTQLETERDKTQQRIDSGLKELGAKYEMQ